MYHLNPNPLGLPISDSETALRAVPLRCWAIPKASGLCVTQGVALAPRLCGRRPQALGKPAAGIIKENSPDGSPIHKAAEIKLRSSFVQQSLVDSPKP